MLDLIVNAGTPKATIATPPDVKIGSPGTIALTGEFLNRVEVTASAGIQGAVQPRADDGERQGKKVSLTVTATAAWPVSITLTRDKKSTDAPLNLIP